MRTVITLTSSGVEGRRTSCMTVIVEFDSESVAFGGMCYPSSPVQISPHTAAGVCVDPVGVTSSKDGGVLVGCEGVIVDHGTEVERLGVRHHPTSITIGGKTRADKVVHPHGFGSGDLG